MKVTGWIVYNGFLRDGAFLDFAEMLQEAAVKRHHTVTIKTNDELFNILFKRTTIKSIDPLPNYVIFIDKDIYLATMLEQLSIPVFNRPQAIQFSDDKITTYLHLVEAGIQIPKTIIAPKTFGEELHIHSNFMQQVIAELNFPFIIKEAFGSFGEQVYLIENNEQLQEKLKIVKGKPFLFQQFIKSSYGVDLRLQVVGDEVVAAMKRTANKDFRANITYGGSMTPHVPTEYEANLAIQATKAIGADFAGVDLLFGKEDIRYVCEVNSNAHIRNLLDCTQINVAPYIIKHIESSLFNKVSSK